jgi:hypothetical protein
MTDQELIARLHKIACHIAADRIEALTDKLAKAVEALSFASNMDATDWSEALDVKNQARATLAEIKGESHD